MTPAEPFASEVQEPAGSGAVDATSQGKRPRRGRRTAQKHPERTNRPRPEDKSALAAWAYVEYQRLRQQGQPPNIQEWCACFPTCRSTLRQVLEVEAYTASFLDRYRPSSGNESIDWPSEGEQRTDFTILRELARGAFARVYLATEASTGGRLVALKCSLYGDAEARTLGRLVHPHIVPILSARRDEQSGLTLVCMPYLGSATLEDLLDHLVAAKQRPGKASFLRDVIRFRAQPEDPPLSTDPSLLRGSYTDSVIRLAAQLAETLAFLHQNGVCHRDLKPSNVLLDPSGKPLLLDFNLSESEREAAVPVGGTLRYMAPEQIRAFLDGRKDRIDARVDLYALGVMVYELLGGVHPCASLLVEPFQPSQAQTMLVDLKASFRPFREICPELERPVAAALDHCVAFEVSDRPKSAADLAAALKLQFTPARRLRRRLATYRRWLTATLASLLFTGAVFAYLWAVTPPYGQRQYDLGLIAYRAGDFDTAELHFDRALHSDWKNARFRYARGSARLQQSKYMEVDQERIELVMEDLKFTKSGPTDVRTLSALAFLQLRSGKPETATKLYNIILRSPYPYRRIMALNNRAYGYFQLGRLMEAQSDLGQAMQIDPHCQAVRYNRAMLGMQLQNQGKIPTIPSQALDDMEQAVGLGPNTSVLYRDAALLYAFAAKDHSNGSYFERALFYLRRAIAGGHTPEHFRGAPSLMEALKAPEFEALLASNRPDATRLPNLRLIDPLEPPD